MKWILLALVFALPASAQAVDPLRAKEPLRSILQREVPDDERGAYLTVWELNDAPGGGLTEASALRTWLWQRDLAILEGRATARMTVAQAIASPLADVSKYQEAAKAYVAARFSIRLAVDGVAGVPPGAKRTARGIYAEGPHENVSVSAVITNLGKSDALVRAEVRLPNAFLRCAAIQLSAGSSGATWCSHIGIGNGAAEKAAIIMSGVKSFDGVVKIADVATGNPVRHVMASLTGPSVPAWEDALGVQQEARKAIEKELHARDESRGDVPPIAWAMLVVIAVILATGGTAHYNSASRPFVPRFLLVGYMMVMLVALVVSGLDSSSGAPMSGVLSLAAKLVMGLPWSLSLLSSENRLPDSSGFPWLFAAGNAALLYVFSMPGRRFTKALSD